LKETLAAAVLLRGGWPRLYHEGGALLDPMCGSGTLLIEGALMAADVAPGLLRYDGRAPTRWHGFDVAGWEALVDEALARERAGLGDAIRWQVRDVASLGAGDVGAAPRGLVACNPPYDARLAADPALYRSLGVALRRAVPGWRASLLCGDRELAFATGLRAKKT